MHLISFALTVPQIQARTKDVTRRMNWAQLVARPGIQLQACGKVMGRKRRDGSLEPLERLAIIETVNVRREPLSLLLTDPEYARIELQREGFPGHDPAAWVAWFIRSHPGCRPDSEITRIEFSYLSRDQH